MIEFRDGGDILQSECDAITNTINCVGVMGAGLALVYKNRYTEMYKEYKKACKHGEVRIGKMWLWTSPEGKLIVNFPTKNHWKKMSLEIYVIQGLGDLRSVINERNIKSLALPALGAGLGGLNWESVKSLIEKWHQTLPADFKLVVYKPQ